MQSGESSAHFPVDEGQPVMPFYIVCDVSYSMKDEMRVLNESLGRLRTEIVRKAAVDDVARLAVITFSDAAEVVLPLSQLSDTTMPHLSAQSGTCYGAAFRTLRQTIETDRDKLKADGLKIFRPCAFFLTDGEAGDSDWQHSFKNTLTWDAATDTGMRSYPIFVPFGFRQARPDDMKQLAYPRDRGKWFLAAQTDPEEAVRGILDLVMRTVMVSSLSAGTGKAANGIAEPGPDSGFISGDSEYI